MTNADKIRNLSDEELVDLLGVGRGLRRRIESTELR